jgi:hypothetical protein
MLHQIMFDLINNIKYSENETPSYFLSRLIFIIFSIFFRATFVFTFLFYANRMNEREVLCLFFNIQFNEGNETVMTRI